jgi:hypothetical protein
MVIGIFFGNFPSAPLVTALRVPVHVARVFGMSYGWQTYNGDYSISPTLRFAYLYSDGSKLVRTILPPRAGIRRDAWRLFSLKLTNSGRLRFVSQGVFAYECQNASRLTGLQEVRVERADISAAYLRQSGGRFPEPLQFYTLVSYQCPR